VDDSFADDDFQSMTNKFDDRFAERHHAVSSGTVITQCHPEVITQCHPERSSRSVIRFAVKYPI
jgi:hypothetical protein